MSTGKPRDFTECIVFEPEVLEDARGYFYEAFNLSRMFPQGVAPSFVQGNVSGSCCRVLRGLHYQWPGSQGKFISVVEGEVWDVAVDIRRSSETFTKWTAVVLSASNRRHLWVPEGFAHGFCVLSDFARLSYLCTAPYDKDADRVIRWNDPQLAIEWPIASPVLSEKDRNAPFLSDLTDALLPP